MLHSRVLGALIGLANAADDHEEMLTDDVLSFVRQVLLTNPQSAQEEDFLIDRIHQVKFTISPSCKTCRHPCGKNSDHDMVLLSLETPVSQALKAQLIDRIHALAALPASPDADAYLIRALRVVSEYHEESSLRAIVEMPLN